MADEHELGVSVATAAQHNTPTQTGGQACDSGSSAQKHRKIGKSITDGSQEVEVDGDGNAGDWQPHIIKLERASRSLINDSLAGCLRTAVTDHLQSYKHQSLATDLEQLQEAQHQCKRLRYRDEHWRAVLAALRLVVQEKRILQGALEALQKH